MGFFIQWLCYLVAFVAGSAVAWLIVTVWMPAGGDKSQKRPDSAAPDAVDEADTTELTGPIDEPETVVLPGLAEADTGVLPRASEVDKR